MFLKRVRKRAQERESRRGVSAMLVVWQAVDATEWNSCSTSWPPRTGCPPSRPTLRPTTALSKPSSDDLPGQVSTQARNKFLLAALKVVSKTPKHTDRWIADTDLALVIRHEHDLLDKALDKVITHTNVNKAVDADLGLSTLTSTSDSDNDGHTFRKKHKPSEVVIATIQCRRTREPGSWEAH